MFQISCSVFWIKYSADFLDKKIIQELERLSWAIHKLGHAFYVLGQVFVLSTQTRHSARFFKHALEPLKGFLMFFSKIPDFSIRLLDEACG